MKVGPKGFLGPLQNSLNTSSLHWDLSTKCKQISLSIRTAPSPLCSTWPFPTHGVLSPLYQLPYKCTFATQCASQMLTKILISYTTLYFYFPERKPGDIDAITDMFVEDFMNFPTTRELGVESARFIRQEMEKTWGEKHMAVLSESESQFWLLGVSNSVL